MKVYLEAGQFPASVETVVTVGSFDGVHLGHKALLQATVEEAERRGCQSVAVTFLPHPRTVLKPAERTWLLSPPDEKIELLERAGVDAVVVIPFDRSFSNTGYREFLQTIIKGRLNASAMVVGYDHRFGRNKDGDYDLLCEEGKGLGIDIIRVGELTGEGQKISSTEVRRAVSAGDFRTAEAILGHKYFALGTIRANVSEVSGNQFFPSDPDKLMPPDGIYKVEFQVGNDKGYTGELRVDKGVYSISEAVFIPDGGEVRVEFL